MNLRSSSFKYFFVVAGLSSAYLGTSAAQANDLAQIRNGQLPKVVPYTAPLQIRVENRNPRVTYDTPADPQPTYLIPLGLPSAKPAPVVILPGPAQNGGSASSGINVPPGYAVIDSNHLPPARLQSNIPAGGTHWAQHLPSGKDYSGLRNVAGKINPQGSGQSAQANPAMHNGQNSRPSAHMPQVSKYAPTGSGNSSASGSDGTSRSTAVSGEVVKRFSLLNK
jgi:hypothetical protein